MTAAKKVAVVGTGVSGLAAAIQLAKGGVAVDVFEAHHELTSVGSGISLQGNSCAPSKSWGSGRRPAMRVSPSMGWVCAPPVQRLRSSPA